MASPEAKRKPEAQNGLAQVPESPECPGTEDKLVPAHEASCRTPGEDQCPVGHSSEPELQEGTKLEKEGLRPDVEAGEEKGSRSIASVGRPSHGPKRKPIKAEGELPPGSLLQKEEPEGSHSESSLPAKQQKKAKKRKSVGAPALPATASTASAPVETLGLERKAQRLRPLYQYINYCNPELNQAGQGERETEVEPEAQLTLVPEEAGAEQMQLQTLLPVAGELGSGLGLPCPNVLVPLTKSLVTPLGEEAGEESGGLSSLRMSGSLKAEVDKSTQVDIDKILSVCAAPLVPPLSPQYK